MSMLYSAYFIFFDADAGAGANAEADINGGAKRWRQR